MSKVPKLSDEALELRRAYLREWRRKNKDKVQQYNASYWERMASKTLPGAQKPEAEK